MEGKRLLNVCVCVCGNGGPVEVMNKVLVLPNTAIKIGNILTIKKDVS